MIAWAKSKEAAITYDGFATLFIHHNTRIKDEKFVAPAKRISKDDRSVAVVSNASNMEAKAAVDDLVEKTENGWMCKPCGKTTSNRKTALSDLRRHAEIHIEGLSFDCQLCDKTFRSRNSFNAHKSRQHT